MTEPISVRVARLRGCEPVPPSEAISWWTCRCSVCHTGSNYSRIDWLQPAAWALLLSEMVEGGWCVHTFQSLWHGQPEHHVQADHDKFSELRVHAPTLGEAVALAWIAWKEEQR